MTTPLETGPKETVILIHGLYMQRWVMALLAARLQRCGYDTRLFAYPSWRGALSRSAASLGEFAASIAAPRLHFVGHSLGGLVILKMLEQHPAIPHAGRALLLGSPYGGNGPAQTLAKTKLGCKVIGRSMLEWLDLNRPVLGDRHELGVIAGCRSLGTGRAFFGLASPNDGVVAVAEAMIPDARDFLLLPVSHAEMLWSREVAQQACAFLRDGSFLHP